MGRPLRRRREQGQSIILVTLALPMILAVVALVIDGTRLFVAHQQTQNTADAAALAGARDLPTSGPCPAGVGRTCGPGGKVESDVNTYAGYNGYSGPHIVSCAGDASKADCFQTPVGGNPQILQVRLTEDRTSLLRTARRAREPLPRLGGGRLELGCSHAGHSEHRNHGHGLCQHGHEHGHEHEHGRHDDHHPGQRPFLVRRVYELHGNHHHGRERQLHRRRPLQQRRHTRDGRNRQCQGLLRGQSLMHPTDAARECGPRCEPAVRRSGGPADLRGNSDSASELAGPDADDSDRLFGQRNRPGRNHCRRQQHQQRQLADDVPSGRLLLSGTLDIKTRAASSTATSSSR